MALAVLGLLATTYGCTSSTPERAVLEFVSARIAGNDEQAAALTVEEDLSGFIGGETFMSGSDISYEAEPADIEGDRATVTVHYTWDEEAVDLPYVCHRVGTKWKVSLRDTEELWLPQHDMDGEPAGI